MQWSEKTEGIVLCFAAIVFWGSVFSWLYLKSRDIYMTCAAICHPYSASGYDRTDGTCFCNAMVLQKRMSNEPH